MKIALALRWLQTCINCPAWSWDPEQRRAATEALGAAQLEYAGKRVEDPAAVVLAEADAMAAPSGRLSSQQVEGLRTAWGKVEQALDKAAPGWRKLNAGDNAAAAIQRLAENARDNERLQAWFRSPEGAAMGEAGDASNHSPAECAIWNLKHSIPRSAAEIQSGHDRIAWAAALIQLLPDTHDGRNSWLMNYYPRVPDKDLTYVVTQKPHVHQAPSGSVAGLEYPL